MFPVWRSVETIRQESHYLRALRQLSGTCGEERRKTWRMNDENADEGKRETNERAGGKHSR